MPIISLMTDFGLKDGNVGVMKGVIWGICPQAQIADLSHTIQPQNVREAALILFRAAFYFPDDTVHMIVVDPGVGTARWPIAAQIGPQRYVCPDNGVLTMILERAGQEGWPVEIVHLDKPQYWLKEVSHVFHGRDIFAPSAAHLASGVPLHALGTPIHDAVKLALPKPQRTENGWRGEVIHVDHFGNVASNIRVEHLGSELSHKERIVVRVGGLEIRGLVNTFGERPEGELIALFGSTGNLIVSLVNGSAAARINAKIGDLFEIILP
ncbi:MAG: SAM-dependent chlorinase/fluorinase [Chloroflexi bacterium]|nr:SAM-dependent chlorinase/fluorinase [Chloroflexota bacterium]